MSIIVVGNSGVGKSYICNRIFERWGCSIRFKSTSSNTSVTNTLQSGSFVHGPSSQTITLLDTPGFFDTKGQDGDGVILCQLVKGLESCEKLFGIIFIFTDRFSTPQKIWYDRIVSILGQNHRAHILLVHNKLPEFDLETKITNESSIKENVGFAQPYFWSAFNGDISQYDDLVLKCVQNPPISLSSALVVPEVCYSRTEESAPFDEEISKNTSDEGQLTTRVKDTSHWGSKTVWNRGNVLGAFGLRGPGAKKIVPCWVTSSAQEQIWVSKMVTRQVVNTYVNVYKVRFDGTKDFKEKKLISQKTNLL